MPLLSPTADRMDLFGRLTSYTRACPPIRVTTCRSSNQVLMRCVQLYAIDTGCQRMAIGWEALVKYQQYLPSELAIHFFPENHQFRSVHQTSITERVAVLPSSLGVRGSFLKPAVFEQGHCKSAPFLISLPFLLYSGAQLVLDEQAGLTLVSERLQFQKQNVIWGLREH